MISHVLQPDLLLNVVSMAVKICICNSRHAAAPSDL